MFESGSQRNHGFYPVPRSSPVYETTVSQSRCKSDGERRTGTRSGSGDLEPKVDAS